MIGFDEDCFQWLNECDFKGICWEKEKWTITPYCLFKNVCLNKNDIVKLGVSGAESINKPVFFQSNYQSTHWTSLALYSWFLFKIINYILTFLYCLTSSFSLLQFCFADGISLKPRGWMQRRCCWLKGTSMVPSSSETVKVREGSSPSQVSKK